MILFQEFFQAMLVDQQPLFKVCKALPPSLKNEIVYLSSSSVSDFLTIQKDMVFYCNSIHWKEGIAPGNMARTVPLSSRRPPGS